MTIIRPATNDDWNNIWSIIEPVFRAGETYTFPTDISKEQAFDLWMNVPKKTYVCENDQGDIVGTYYIKANQYGPGDHVCNCGYIVGEKARGLKIAPKLNLHSQEEAVRLGFRAMQYNAVVSTNEKAVRLWTSLGFDIIGRLPGAFRHPNKGYVDCLVMYKTLISD